MEIGIDASRAATRQRTGTEGYAFFLIRALLPPATARGHQVHLYFNAAPVTGDFPQTEQIQHHVMPFPRLWTHLRLAAHLHLARPDIFFTPAHVVPLTYFGPSVATVHDLGYYYFPEAHPARQRRYLRWSTCHNARRSRMVIVDSQATGQDLVQFCDTTAHKISVIYPGADPELQEIKSSSEVERVLRRHGVTQPYLLYLGTLQPRKNLQRLIRAFAASGVEQALVLAGKQGWLAEPILAEIARQPATVAARIRLIGYVPETDKAALLSGATALIFPSLYEGFGFPVLEAQACGTPVLCSDSSSLPEVAGQGALLVNGADEGELAEAIQQIVEDRRLRENLIVAGEANLARFSWATAAEQLLDVLEKAAAG